jgi:hypothetical protein
MTDSQNHDTDSSSNILSIPAAPPKSQWYKRKLFLIPILVILVVIVGYFYYASQNKTQQTIQHDTDTNAVMNVKPQALVYVSSAENIVSKDCIQKTDTIHYKDLSNQKVTDAVTISDHQSVTAFATHHDAVILATEPSCTSKEGSSLWLSQDSGKTYKKFYTIENTLGRITSIAFSTDGSEVVFGALPTADHKTISAITIKSGKARDLFISKRTGHLDTFYDVKAYDQKKQRVYYLEGCSLCDRMNEGTLWQYDLKNGKNSVALKSAERYSYGMIISNDASKVIRMEYTNDANSRLRQFTINEFSLATGKQTDFATYTGAAVSGVAIGYTSDGSIYYSTDKKFMTVNDEGQSSELAPVPDQTSKAYYVSKSRIIYPTSNQSGGEVIDHDIKSGKSTLVLKYEYPATPQGISYTVTRTP